jgi:hypothetical protein
MTYQAESAVPDEASLDVLVEAERRLDQQLSEARQQADQRVQQARLAAQDRLGRARQRLAADAARRLAEGQQAVDDLLAREAETKEQELARTCAGFEAFRAALCARMLAEVWGR